MKHYEDFQITGASFAERIGQPDEFDAALGNIVIGFSYLEDTARNVISLLLGLDSRVGMIVGAELSFRQKLDLLASLVWYRLSEVTQADRDLAEEHFREILILCRRSEELRNQHLHSRYSRSARSKTTAKANRGLHTVVRPTNPDILLDVADFIVSTSVILEEFPLLLGIVDRVGGSGERVEYSQQGRTIAVFDFGEPAV